MDAAAIIAAILSVINLASKAIQLGMDATPFAQALYDHIFNKTVITQDDLDALEAKIDALSDELQLPLPPE